MSLFISVFWGKKKSSCHKMGRIEAENNLRSYLQICFSKYRLTQNDWIDFHASLHDFKR